MTSLQELERLVAEEAARAEFPVDRPVYELLGKDPMQPVLCGGNPAAKVCSFGRDPGRDEIKHQQPQVGAAGQLVRKGVQAALGLSLPASDRLREGTLEHLFLSNTVPYKPIGNKAYGEKVKERFRPLVARLLLEYWQGDVVLTLGTEAFQWFARYGEGADEFWALPDRYEAEWPCVLRAETPNGTLERALTICPLPHPSPLNAQWVGKFPGLLEQRLKKAGLGS